MSKGLEGCLAYCCGLAILKGVIVLIVWLASPSTDCSLPSADCLVGEAVMNSLEACLVGLGDARYCNQVNDCADGSDEPEGCQQHMVIVLGSDGMDNVFKAAPSEYYSYYQSGQNYLVKTGDSWVLASGGSETLTLHTSDSEWELTVSYYVSRQNSSRVPIDGWRKIGNLSLPLHLLPSMNITQLGKEEQDEPDLKTISVPTDSEDNLIKIDGGYTCKAAWRSDQWIWIPEDNSGQCDSQCECSTGFLVVRGPKTKFNGVYEIHKNSGSGKDFFKHLGGGWLIYKENQNWVLGEGGSPAEAVKVLYNPAKVLNEKEDVPATGWLEKGGWPVDTMRVTQVTKTFTLDQMLHAEDGSDGWEDGLNGWNSEGLLCKGADDQRLFITKSGGDPFLCDGRHHCKSGEDERSCSFIVDMSMEEPILTTLGAVLGGILLFFVFRICLGSADSDSDSYDHSNREEEREEREREERERVEREREDVNNVDQIIKLASSPVRTALVTGTDLVAGTEMTSKFQNVRDSGRLPLLIGSAFTFPTDPTERYHMANIIFGEEKKIQNQNNNHTKKYLRKHIGSNQASATFLGSLSPPGCLAKLTYEMREAFFCLCCHRFGMREILFPLLGVALYVFDYIKDSWFFLYLVYRLPFIYDRCSLLYGLIYVYGSSILVAGILMGITIQTDETIKSKYLKGIFSRILMALLTPLAPVFVIMEAILVSGEKEKIIAEWKKNQSQSAKKWIQFKALDVKSSRVMQAYSDIKMVECSIEAVLQFGLLVIFTAVSIILPKTSGLGLIKDDNVKQWTYVALALLATYVNMIQSILTAVNIQKRDQLGIKDKVVLGLSYTLQLLVHLLLLVPTALLALPQNDTPAATGDQDASITNGEAGLLLAMPILFRWGSILALHGVLKYCTKEGTRFWDLGLRTKILHVLSNTWVTIPLRATEKVSSDADEPEPVGKPEPEPVRKGKEITGSLIFASMGILVSGAMTFLLMEKQNSRMLLGNNSKVEFLLLAVLPAYSCHLAGCALLFIFYSCCHPWSEVFKHKEGRAEEQGRETNAENQNEEGVPMKAVQVE